MVKALVTIWDRRGGDDERGAAAGFWVTAGRRQRRGGGRTAAAATYTCTCTPATTMESRTAEQCGVQPAAGALDDTARDRLAARRGHFDTCELTDSETKGEQLRNDEEASADVRIDTE